MPVDDVAAVVAGCAAVDAMVAMKIECAVKGESGWHTSRRFARMTYQLKKLKIEKYKIRCFKLFDIKKLMQGICRICQCLQFVQSCTNKWDLKSNSFKLGSRQIR